MNVLIQLSHPAHFHLYKLVAKNLIDDGHKVLFVIKSKDILEQLLQNAGLPYVNINQHAHRGSKFGILWDMFVREWRIWKLCRKHKINLLTGSTPEVAHVAKLTGRRSVNTGEDDADVISMFIKIAKPFIDGYAAPDPCEMGPVEPRTTHYPGYHELAYLHPNHFTPDPEIVCSYGIPVPSSPSQLVPQVTNSSSDSSQKEQAPPSSPSQLVPQVPNKSSINSQKEQATPSSNPQLVPQVTNSSSDSLQKEQAEPYFILRFASLNAHHDDGIKGINTEIAQRLVDILKPHGRIYITSERPLEPQFEQYRIKINPLDMHHVMAFASLYIGDSQTMAAEAGVLGVPFVRFNDFVGRIGYLRELEDTYHLGFGIKASSPGSVDQLCARVSELVAMNPAERHATFAARRATMLADKIDCAKFLTYFIEEYPKSAEQTRQGGAEFWDRFK